MSNQINKPDTTNSVIIVGAIVLIILFGGSPDLMDAIIYKLTGYKGW